MKILWIVPILGTDERELARRPDGFRRFLYPGTELVVRGVKRGTESIESRLDEAYIALPVREEAISAQEEGFDACVIGCAGDAGVAVSKESVSIPVVGPAEAAVSVFRLIGKKVVILNTIPDRIASVEDRFAGYLPRHRFVIYPSNLRVLDMRRDMAHTIDVLSELVIAAVDRDRADCAILGCAAMRGMAEQVQEKAGIPVIDPMAAAIQMAQVLVTMRHSQSRRAYPFPPEKRRIL